MSFLGVVGSIIGGIGSIISASGASEAASAQSQAAAYNAQVANNNAIIANQYAESAIQAGEAKTNQVQMQNRAAVGAIEAAQGANNVDVNTGSAVDVRAGQREVGNVNALNTQQEAAQTAYGYRVAATNYGAQAGLYTAESQQALTAGQIASTGSLVSGAGSLLGNWSKLQLATGGGGGTDTSGLLNTGTNSTGLSLLGFS